MKNSIWLSMIIASAIICGGCTNKTEAEKKVNPIQNKTKATSTAVPVEKPSKSVEKVETPVPSVLSKVASVFSKPSEPKFIEIFLVRSKFEKVLEKFGKFENDYDYVCKDPSNCRQAYFQRSNTSCLSKVLSIKASKKTGEVVSINFQVSGQCNMYDDNPPVKDFIDEDGPEPIWIKRNADRSVSAAWKVGTGYGFLSAWCGNTPGDWSQFSGSLHKRMRDCRVTDISADYEADLEKSFQADFKVKNFAW